MQTLYLVSKSGSDGVLHLDVPVEVANAKYDVVVVFHPKANNEPAKSEDRGWPAGFFENTAGSIDDPTFERHAQGEFEKRLEI